MAVAETSACSCSGTRALCAKGVSIGPGLTTLTLMPRVLQVRRPRAHERADGCLGGGIDAEARQALDACTAWPPWCWTRPGEPAAIDAAAPYLEALGGKLDLVATFGDHTVTSTEAA